MYQFEEVDEFIGIFSRGQVHKVSRHSVAEARTGLNSHFTGRITECRPLLEKGKGDKIVCTAVGRLRIAHLSPSHTNSHIYKQTQTHTLAYTDRTTTNQKSYLKGNYVHTSFHQPT